MIALVVPRTGSLDRAPANDTVSRIALRFLGDHSIRYAIHPSLRFLARARTARGSVLASHPNPTAHTTTLWHSPAHALSSTCRPHNPSASQNARGGAPRHDLAQLVPSSTQRRLPVGAQRNNSQGETVEELRDNLGEVVEMLLEDGEPELASEFVGTATVRVG